MGEMVDEDVALAGDERHLAGWADTAAPRSARHLVDRHKDAVAQAEGQLVSKPEEAIVVRPPVHDPTEPCFAVCAKGCAWCLRPVLTQRLKR